jgi:hypothetical protein
MTLLRLTVESEFDIQQFRSPGAFCLLSYAREIDFSRTELDDLIDQSSKLVGLNIERSKVLDDYDGT